MQDEISKKCPACKSSNFFAILKGEASEEGERGKRLIFRIGIFSCLLFCTIKRTDKKRFCKVMAPLVFVIFLFQSGFGNPAERNFYSPSVAHASWYASEGIWGYRRSITVDHTKVSKTDQLNFPMLVSLADLDLRWAGNGGHVENPNGYDIIFTSDDGVTRLDYEIEEYAAAAGKIVAWVKIPVLSCTADTVIYMYYGNSSAANLQNKNGTWDSNFKMVQHMNQDPSIPTMQMIDSTQCGNNGTSYGSMVSDNWKAGKIGGAIGFDGTDDYIGIPKITPPYMTAGAWIYLSSYYTHGTAPSIIQSYGAESGDYGGFRIAQNIDSNTLFCIVSTATGTATHSGSSNSLSLNAWHYVDCSYDGSGVKLYVDGVLSNSTNIAGAIRTPAVSYDYIGYGRSWHADTNNGSWSGVMDEARISSVARSADWIKTEYNNQFDPGSFYNLGSIVDSGAYYFAVAADSIQAAGDSQTIAITVTDVYGNADAAYAGEKSLVFSGAHPVGNYIPTCTDKNGADIPFGDSTVLDFADGKAMCNLKLYKAEKANVSFTDGKYNTSFRIDVSAQAFHGFNISIPASTKTGEPFATTVIPCDYYGNHAFDITKDTFISVNKGSIDNTYIPASFFNGYTGPDNLLYSHKKDISITNNIAQNLTAYQIKVVIDTASLISGGKMQDNCNDLRFSEDDGTNIPYWIESGCNNSSTAVWIKTDIGASAIKNIHAYYGNASAASESNADRVFIFYDDFENGLGKWTETTATVYSENGNHVLKLATGSGDYASTAVLPDYQNIIVESKFKFNGFGTFGPRFDQDIDPMRTIIESFIDGSHSAWHQTWLGTVSEVQIARGAPSWFTNREYSSKLISTGSLQRWEVGETVLSGTYARAAVVSGSKLKYWTWDSGNDLYIYWVKIRQYAAVEPTVEVKTEESASGVYSGEFTISGILQDAYVSITLQSGNVASVADIWVEAADHVSHFEIEGMDSQTAGSSQTITISVMGESGNSYLAYEGEYDLIFSGAFPIGAYVPSCKNKNGVDTPFGSPTALSFANGMATCELKLYKAGVADIAVSDNSHTSAGYGLQVAVLADSIYSFVDSIPTAAVSGVPFALSLTARDRYGNILDMAEDAFLSASAGTVTPSIPAGSFQNGSYAGNITVSEIAADTNIVLTVASGSVSQSVHMLITAKTKEEADSSGGGAFILPSKPDVSNTRLILSGGRLSIVNMPALATEISVSDSADFLNSSWESIERTGHLLNTYLDFPKIYAKFRGKKGGVSDVIVFDRTASVFADAALKDGDAVRAEGSFDVYIVKLANGKQFCRLILSPNVFNSYQHLKWENIKTIPSLRMDGCIISNLVQVKGDKEVYELFPDGDTGKKRIFNMAQSYDPDAVYEINRIDRDSYKTVP